MKRFKVVKGNILLDYTNLFSTNKYEKNDKIILEWLYVIIMSRASFRQAAYLKFK